jgi:hypothetical protein
VGTSEHRKSRVETRPIVSKSRRTQLRPLDAAMLHRHPLRVKATQFPRRQFLRVAAGAAALPAVSGFARAQAYPTRPVRLVVGFPAGGGADIVARLIGQWLSERLGQQFIIENRPGAASNLAAQAVVRASPDGYTLFVQAGGSPPCWLLRSRWAVSPVRTTSPAARRLPPFGSTPGQARAPFVTSGHCRTLRSRMAGTARPARPATTVPRSMSRSG